MDSIQRASRPSPDDPPAVAAHVERAVIALALAWPTWGPERLSVQLARQGIEIAASTVYRTLGCAGLGTRLERPGILEQHTARQAGLRTERTCSSVIVGATLRVIA